MKDYAIIFNPKAAAGKNKEEFNEIKRYLNNLGVSYEIFYTKEFEHGISLAEQCAKDGYRVIGAGGDGTCNEVLNGVINAKKKSPIGFIPLGSGNDIPGAIGVSNDIKRACEIIAEGNTGVSDVGMAITDGENDSPIQKRYFLGIGSQGFDAEVTRLTNEGEKTLEGTNNYVKNVLKTVFSFKKRKVKMTINTAQHNTEKVVFNDSCNLIAVANGPSYGGGMYICPYAKVNDGLFHISISQMGTFKLLYNFNKMYSRCLHPHPNVFEFVARKVKLEMSDPSDTPYIGQVDGEIVGNLPIIYDFLGGGYEFIKPKENEYQAKFYREFGKKYAKHCKKHGILETTVLTPMYSHNL